ncbi:MAG: hypothetical protein JWR23_1861 [Mucilaginibacter sp.]|nr:hypothetical protein [Mucilaginibacter sp.]
MDVIKSWVFEKITATPNILYGVLYAVKLLPLILFDYL